MKRNYDKIDLREAFAPMPEACYDAMMNAVRSVKEDKPMKRITFRAVGIAAVILVLLMAAAYAAFSSQVVAFFGRMYGDDMVEWLGQGDLATANQSYALGDVVYTLDEVIYRNNGLYGYGTIRPRESSNATLIAMDCTPDEPFGYDVHGAGGTPEEAPEGTPTVADVARERGGKLYMVNPAIPEKIGVDGGELLSPGSVGMEVVPMRDGSIEYMFEVSDAFAVGEGSTYTLVLNVRYDEMSLDGSIPEGSRQQSSWTVEIQPEPMMVQVTAPPDVSAVEETLPGEAAGVQAETASDVQSAANPRQAIQAALAAQGIELIAPDEYYQTGVMPVYRAIARDFGKNLRPELFNQSGVAEQDDYSSHFNDGGLLQWAPEALFYWEESDTLYNSNFKEPDLPPAYYPMNTLATEASSLAGWAINGWPVTEKVYQLESTTLTYITLEEAQATLEALMAELNLSGYAPGIALDMSVQRIRDLGNDMNAMRESGEMGGNSPQYDYNAATPDDEGYYLGYYAMGEDADTDRSGDFSVYAYVTAGGIVTLNIRDSYMPGEIYDTSDALIDPQAVLDALPREIADSRFPELMVDTVVSVRLVYQPMRAPNKQDGMVLSPVWLVQYYNTDDLHQNWAEFNAVDGTLLSASFKG